MSDQKQRRNSRDSQIEMLAERIMGYLQQHPEAEDTLEAITEWWILEQNIRVEMMKVQEALERLVEGNALAMRRGGDGRATYRLNPQHG